MAVHPGDDTRGIVRPDRLGRSFTLERRSPGPPLDRFVDRFWRASWELEKGQRHHQRIVTHPAVNLVFESGGAALSGVLTETFVRELTGSGRALGVMFRPGGFRPFLGHPMKSITDRTVTIGEVFGPEGTQLAASLRLEDMSDSVRRVSAFLARRVPADPGPSEEVSAVVELIQADPSMSSVRELAERLAIHPRRLQRLFAEHVGVSPRWVIGRARLHAAAEEVKRGSVGSWAELAATLGYADQAHLTRRFKHTVGDPPGRYARRLDRGEDS